MRFFFSRIADYSILNDFLPLCPTYIFSFSIEKDFDEQLPNLHSITSTVTYLGEKEKKGNTFFTDKIAFNLKGFSTGCFLFRSKYSILVIHSFD